MPLSIGIPDQDIRYLNERAKDELHSSVERYVRDILTEAGRLEVATKTTAGNPEYTSSMIKDADVLLRKGYRRPRKKILDVGIYMISFGGWAFAGSLFDFQKLRDSGTVVAFTIVLIVTVASSVLAITRE
jgi:hypothetical protein